jgi:hypothetical protein
MADEAVGFDVDTARRVLKVVRAVEASGLDAEPTRNKRVPIPMEIVVPRSLGGDGWYVCDLFIFETSDDSYVRVLQNQKMKLMPDTL